MDSVSRLTRWLGRERRASNGSEPTTDATRGEDWRLWAEACAGRQSSAAQLVRMLTPQAYGLAMQLVGKPEDAEDAVQESFLRLWRSTPSSDHGARLSTYFNTIVINRCRSALVGRREQATEPEALADLHDAHQQAGHDDGDDAIARASGTAMPARLQAALDKLPARQRMAVAMWAYADASVAEVARSLDIDPNAAHQLLHRAKTALRSHLEGGAR
jgi:RNA polymerase sigma-70 factor, ECF subfamily